LPTLPTLTSFCRLNLTLSSKAYNTKSKSIKVAADTLDISIKMVKEKELEYTYLQLVRSTQENGILINYIDAQRFNSQMVTVIGGNIRMMREMDMEHMRLLMETDTLGNSSMETVTGTEYTGMQMEEFIMRMEKG
jgi:hypothetical protein